MMLSAGVALPVMLRPVSLLAGPLIVAAGYYAEAT